MEKSNKDEKGNVIIGNVLAKDIKNSYIISEKVNRYSWHKRLNYCRDK